MKKISVLLLIVSVMLFAACAKHVVPKEYTVPSPAAMTQMTAFDSAGKFVSRNAYTYTGNLLTRMETDSNTSTAEADYATTYEYTGGILTRSNYYMIYGSTSTLISYYLYAYNGSGQLISKMSYLYTGTLTDTTTYTNSGGRLVSTANSFFTINYSYDSAGRISQEQYMLTPPTVFMTVKYEYNESGKLKYTRNYDATGTLSSYSSVGYDGKGRPEMLTSMNATNGITGTNYMDNTEISAAPNYDYFNPAVRILF